MGRISEIGKAVKNRVSALDWKGLRVINRWFSLRLLGTGLAVSVLCSVLFMATYGFYGRLNIEFDDTLVADYLSEYLTEVYRYNYVLYRNLYQRMSGLQTDYGKLYFSSDIPELEIPESTSESSEYVSSDWDDLYMQSVTNIRNILSGILQDKDDHFSWLGEHYDYWVVGLDENGNVLTDGTGWSNTNYGFADDPDIRWQDYYCSFQINYDKNGNPTVSNVQGTNAEEIRRQIDTILHMDTFALLTSNTIEENLSVDDAFFVSAVKQASFIQNPVNCQITYALSKENIAALERNGRYLVDSYNSSVLRQGSDLFEDYGMGALYLSIVFALCLFGWFYANPREEGKRAGRKLLRLPIELVVYGLTMVSAWRWQMITYTAQLLLLRRGTLISSNRLLNIPLGGGLAYVSHFFHLLIPFFCAWYLGCCLGEIRQLGVWGYFKRRCFCYQIFPWMRRKWQKFYNSYVNLDLTERTKDQLVKLLIVNGILVGLLCCTWFVGLFGVLIYSFVLYLILKRYLSNLQKKYGILLGAANQIAEGNLNVQIEEPLGVFEPFKPHFLRIQEGFKKAVDEETKSQRMKSELITNVSHDLKTPLTAIITYINLLKQENVTEEERKQYLETLEMKSLRLKVLIEDLFEVSKANSRSVKLSLQEVDLVNLLKQVFFEMSDKLEERQLVTKLMLPEEKLVLQLDSQKAYRVYANLLSNIAKYAMAGTRVYVNLTESEQEVSVVMKNIAEAELDIDPTELTERFVRGDVSRNTEGSGLGLAIVKSFVELQGGRLEIDVDGDLFKVTTTWKK